MRTAMGSGKDRFLNIGRSLIDREMNLTLKGGLLNEMSSLSYSFGFHRRIADVDGVDQVVDAFTNRGLGAHKGKILDHVYEDGVRNPNKYKLYNSIDDAIAASGKTGVQASFMKFNLKAGGLTSHMLGIGFTSFFALAAGISKYSETGSVMQGLGSTGYALAESAIFSKVAATVIGNPLVAAAVVAPAVGIYSVYAAKNYGNNYLRGTRFSTMSGQVSPSAGGRMSYTMRQRALQSMEFSRFNTMRALGNETSMYHSPRSSYGRSPGGFAPILGY